MQVGVLGVGRMGARHAQLLSLTSGVSGVVVADVDRQRARSVAASLGATERTPDELLDAVDAVVVAAGPDHHPAAVRAAVARGLPVLCEKPLAADLPETIAVAEEVERSGAGVRIGFQRRFDPAYAESRRRLDAGELGRVFLVRLAAHDPVADAGGLGPDTASLFRDSSIHDFDLAGWLTGSEIVEVHAVGATRHATDARDVDPDVAVVTMRAANGALCVLTGMHLNARGYDIRGEVYGTRDSVAIGFGPRTPIRDLEPGGRPLAPDAWTDYLERFDEAYRRELAAFVEFAAGGPPLGAGVRDALAAMRIAVAATRSLAEARPVALAEVPGAVRAPAGVAT